MIVIVDSRFATTRDGNHQSLIKSPLDLES